jgi:concentrative nucleoside transporter, CNT family
MERLISLLGLAVFLLLAWALSENRRRINFRLIVSGVALQFGLAVFLLRTWPGQQLYGMASDFITVLVECSDRGSAFLFGETLVKECPGFTFLPAIIFVSALTAILFHLGVLQWVVKLMAWVMVWVMDVSGTESLAASANVFVGNTEAPLVIRPYLESMTKSELMAMMTGGMATIAGGVMAVYAKMLIDAGADPGHLLTASLISAPAALVMAKIMVPETEESPTKGTVKIDVPRQDENILDAACRGASEGLKLALNVGAMLIAFIAIVALINWTLTGLPQVGGEDLTLERCLGWLCAPVAWMMGIPWSEAPAVGQMLGKRTIVNEFLAYIDLVRLKDQLSERSFIITTYALCGFANFGTIAIQIGGIGGLVPSRRKEFARYGFRAMIGGTLAAYMTATIAGILIEV